MPDAYAGWKLEAAAPADYAGWKLQPADAPAPERVPDGREVLGNAVMDAGKSALKWASTPFAAMQPILAEQKADSDAAGPPAINRILGYDEKTEPDWLTGAKAFVGGIPGAQAGVTGTAADERMGQFRDQHPIASFLLPLAGAGGKPAFLPAMAAKPAGPAVSWLQRLEAKLTNQVGDAGVKGAEETANSAMGSYRSARGDTSTILKALERVTGDPATDAASRQLLESPAGKKLIMEVVQNAQTRAPEALDRVEGLKSLVDETRAAIPEARAAATSDEGLRAALSQRTKDQIGRYAIPAVGATVGAHIGGPVGFGIGAAAGRGVSPGVRAVVLNNVLAPERRLLMTRSALNTAQKLAAVPERLGKFALPLTQAAAKGSDAMAATHYILAQDPQYQDLIHQAAEGQ